MKHKAGMPFDILVSKGAAILAEVGPTRSSFFLSFAICLNNLSNRYFDVFRFFVGVQIRSCCGKTDLNSEGDQPLFTCRPKERSGGIGSS